MRFYTFALFAVTCLINLPSTFAQNGFVFSYEGAYASFGGNNQCKNLQVIDARKEKDNIGYLKKGAFNRNTPVVTEQPFDVFLQSTYDSMKVAAKTKNEELIMVLYQFELQDRPDAGEVGTFCFSADFFRGENGQYKFVASVDSFYEVRSSFDVTKTLIGNTQKKLSSILGYYASQSADINANKLYSPEQLKNKRSDDKLLYPIYNTTEYKKGVYYTCNDFLNNKPDEVPIVKWAYSSGADNVTHFYYQDNRGKRGSRIEDNAFFAIYDGKEWWVSDLSTARHLKYADGDFYATRLFRQAYTGSNSNAAMFFGLTGALIASAVDGGNVKASWTLYKSRLNPATKQFVPVSRPK